FRHAGEMRAPCGPLERKTLRVGSNQKMRTATKPILPDPNRNLGRDERRNERIMLGIAQHQLESVLAGRQLDARLGLACSEMKMGLVLWNRLVGIEWFIHINQQMMMAAVLKIVARVGD